MSATPRKHSKNQILASLPAEDYESPAPNLEPVEMTHGKVIQESGGRITHVYFPEWSMVSRTSEGESVGVGIVGSEGMVSTSAVLGVDTSTREMAVPALREEVRRAGVSVAADKLKAGSLIDYRRVLTCVPDRTGLEAVTCECYAIVRKEFDRFLAGDG